MIQVGVGKDCVVINNTKTGDIFVASGRDEIEDLMKGFGSLAYQYSHQEG